MGIAVLEIKGNAFAIFSFFSQRIAHHECLECTKQAVC